MCVDDESVLSADSLLLTSRATEVLVHATLQHLQGLFNYSRANRTRPGSLADVIAYPLWRVAYQQICPHPQSTSGWDRINDVVVRHNIGDTLRDAIAKEAK